MRIPAERPDRVQALAQQAPDRVTEAVAAERAERRAGQCVRAGNAAHADQQADRDQQRNHRHDHAHHDQRIAERDEEDHRAGRMRMCADPCQQAVDPGRNHAPIIGRRRWRVGCARRCRHGDQRCRPFSIESIAMSPSPSQAAELLALADNFYLPVYAQRRMVIERGQGARIWDTDGNEYVDFAAGIAVCGFGHADPDLVDALVTQAQKIWHHSNVFHSEPPLLLAQELVEASKFATHVFFTNSGAEANEAAIKLARKWASKRGVPPENRVIVSFKGSFHGRTLATVTATAQPKYQAGYEPLPQGFRYAEFNDLDSLREAMAQGDVIGVLLEPVQGEGGCTPVAPGFLRGVRELCDAHDALLILDEIQCGMGRTGTLFAHWQDEVTPDIVTLAKALGGGFPIGAMLSGPKLAEAMYIGAHGSTFGGNPLAAAVASAVLKKLRSAEIVANVKKQETAFRDALAAINAELDLFSEVRGRGLMLGAALKPEHAGKAAAILDIAAAHGVLLLNAGPDVLRFVPALNIADVDVAEGFVRLRAALAQFKQS
ncbi:MAG: acetylornithine/succinylornithine family transaminase [Myxococcales bacterium]